MSRPTDAPWVRHPSLLEPPTMSAYDRQRRRKRVYFLLCLVLAAALAAVVYCKLRDQYRAGGSVVPHQQQP